MLIIQFLDSVKAKRKLLKDLRGALEIQKNQKKPTEPMILNVNIPDKPAMEILDHLDQINANLQETLAESLESLPCT